MKVLTREEVNAESHLEWLWDGIIPTHAVVVLAARGGLGKSALMTGLCMAMVNGLDYLGRSVRRGTVLYVVLEGFAGLRARLRGWEIHLGVPVDSSPVPVSRTLNLTELRALQNANRYDLIVVDTASKTGLIENENGNTDVAQFLADFDQAVHDGHPSATGVVIHHVTESIDNHGRRSSKARGASAWRDNADTLILLTGTQANMTLTTDHPYGKQRDGAPVTIRGLAVEPIALADDETAVIITMTEQEDDEGGEDDMKTASQDDRHDREAKTDFTALRRQFKNRKPSRDEAKKALGIGSDRARRALELWN